MIERSGGLATRADLIRATSRADVDRAVARGSVRRVGHGRYALPGVEQAAATAHRLNGHLSLTSAAVHHGWEVKTVPPLPHVVFARKRNVPRLGRREVVVHRADLGPTTSQASPPAASSPCSSACARCRTTRRWRSLTRPFGTGRSRRSAGVMASVRGAGSAKVRRIGLQADARAANPFESVMRAICLQVPGLSVTPQLVLSGSTSGPVPTWSTASAGSSSSATRGSGTATGRASSRTSVATRCSRADGWTVLRFTWDDVMLRPAWVRDVLSRAVGVDARTEAIAVWPVAA